MGGFGLASGQDEAVVEERPKFGVGLLDEATRESNSGDDARCQRARMDSSWRNATGVVPLEWWVLLARLGSCLHLPGHPKFATSLVQFVCSGGHRKAKWDEPHEEMEEARGGIVKLQLHDLGRCTKPRQAWQLRRFAISALRL